jgi:hypothetical protein
VTLLGPHWDHFALTKRHDSQEVATGWTEAATIWVCLATGKKGSDKLENRRAEMRLQVRVLCPPLQTPTIRARHGSLRATGRSSGSVEGDARSANPSLILLMEIPDASNG